MIKIAVVVQRYGNEVVGGAETLAKDVSERLNRTGFDVTVFTTTAKDYITWENHFKQGVSILKGVEIRRFPVDRVRDIDSFNDYSEVFFTKEQSVDEENMWIDTQGPVSSGLKEAVEKGQGDFDVFMFFTYLYYSTVKIINLVKKPVILFPTAHDELPFHLKIMKDVFKRPDSFFFLTGAEQDLVEKSYHPNGKMNLLRTGIDIVENIDENLFRLKYAVVAPFILYAGRIERGKGLETVFEAYRKIRDKSVVNLVLMGKKFMDIPDTDGIRYVGFVSEEEKLSAFKGAMFSIQPSHFESLSITTLESFSQKTPVLVNRKSNVLMEHVDISKGGTSYESVEDFIDKFDFLNIHPSERIKMGKKGFDYVKEYFSWDVVLKKIDKEVKRLTKKS